MSKGGGSKEVVATKHYTLHVVKNVAQTENEKGKMQRITHCGPWAHITISLCSQLKKNSTNSGDSMVDFHKTYQYQQECTHTQKKSQIHNVNACVPFGTRHWASTGSWYWFSTGFRHWVQY